MRHGEVHGESSQAAVRGQSESRMLIEDFAVQMDANVSFHVFGAVVEHLKRRTHTVYRYT